MSTHLLAAWGALASRGALASFGALAAIGCAAQPVPWVPDRRDDEAFRRAQPELLDRILEPNYLPFLAHRVPADPVPGSEPGPGDGTGSGDLLCFCRWPDEAMPLAVAIDPPRIPDELQDEFHPIEPARYVAAVASALQTWQDELEGLVRFRRVARGEKAALRIRILGREAPAPEPAIRVLGSARIEKACRKVGEDPRSGRILVDYSVSDLELFVADRFGLLTPDQVGRVALHELGHALGMPRHSPTPTDLMYPILKDHATVDRLSIQDVHSFVSLYQLPNGTRFGRVPEAGRGPRPVSGPPPGAPELSLGPYVDARLGFEVRPPSGWVRVPNPHGLFAANGPIWDWDASFEVFVTRYATLESYLADSSELLFADTWLRQRERIAIAGHPALRIAVEDARGEVAEEFTFIEVGDGRLVIVFTECPAEFADAWRPWFRAALGSLEIWPGGR